MKIKSIVKVVSALAIACAITLTTTALPAFARDPQAGDEHVVYDQQTGKYVPEEGWTWDSTNNVCRVASGYKLDSTGKPVKITTNDDSVAKALENLNNGDGTFDELDATLSGALGSLYRMVRNISMILLFIDVFVAIACFGVFKNEQVIQKNKQQIGRIVLAVFGMSIVGTVFGLVQTIGSSVGP